MSVFACRTIDTRPILVDHPSPSATRVARGSPFSQTGGRASILATETTQMESTTLNWGMPHSLKLQPRGGGLKATLHLTKTNGTQSLHITLTPPVTIEAILQAWQAQGEKWDEIILCQQPVFIARRMIWLPTGALAWDVFHFNDAPYDTFGYVPLTREAWLHAFPAAKLTLNAVA